MIKKMVNSMVGFAARRCQWCGHMNTNEDADYCEVCNGLISG